MRVAVVISTYNGEKYLVEQIDSILNQQKVEVELFIRDDGSSDGTIKILQEYENRFLNVHIEFGKNVGYSESFLLALNMAKGFDYYSFGDQDDFWEPCKLERACSWLNDKEIKEKPALYYSNLCVTDENLRPYKVTSLEKRKKTLESVMMRRSIAGCTVVINQKLKDEVSSLNWNKDMLKMGHDSLIISICYALGGSVMCDDKAYIKYRQHGNNTSGSSHGLKARLKKEIIGMRTRKGGESAIAHGIIQHYGDKISIDKKKSLNIIAKSQKSIVSRIKIVFSWKFTTGNIILTSVGKFKALIGVL